MSSEDRDASRFQNAGDELGRFRRRFDLLELALAGALVGAEAHELAAVAEAIAGDLVVGDFDHDPPGAFPVKPGVATSASGFAVSVARSLLAMVVVKPT